MTPLFSRKHMEDERDFFAAGNKWKKVKYLMKKRKEKQFHFIQHKFLFHLYTKPNLIFPIVTEQ